MAEARGLDMQFWLNLKNACREIIALEVAYLFNRTQPDKGEKSPFPSPPQRTSPSPTGGEGEGFSYGRPKAPAALCLWFADGRGAVVHAAEVEELKIETAHLLEGTGASLEFSVLNRQEAQELRDVVKKGAVIYERDEESLAKLRREVLGAV